MKKLTALLQRHAAAAWYALTVILPVILRTGRRPVIFSKYSGIGDIICTFPAVLELKKKHPGAVFIYNCHKPYGCLPVIAGITNRVSHLRHFGVLHHWYARLCESVYEFPSADEGMESFCREYLVSEYAKNHGVKAEPNHPYLAISTSISGKIAALIHQIAPPATPLIIIHPGPTWPIKEWPRESWCALISQLKGKGYSTIIQVGTSSHLALGTVNDPSLPGTISLVNKLSLEECVGLIASAALFIGVDSGLIHVAASLKVPSFGIFGPTSPHIILPQLNAIASVTSRISCQGCHHRIPRIHWETGCPYNAQCMKEIAVEEVLAACLRVLNQSPCGGG